MHRFVALVLALSLFPSPGGARTAAPQWPGRVGFVSAVTAHESVEEHAGAERGCSALFHLCSCHVSPSSTPSVPTQGELGRVPASAGRFLVAASKQPQTRNAEPPPLPPPIA